MGRVPRRHKSEQLPGAARTAHYEQVPSQWWSSSCHEHCGGHRLRWSARMGVELGKCSAACRGLGRSAKYRESPGLNLAYLGSLENRGKFVGRSIGLAEHTDPKVQLASPGVGPEPAIDGEERIGRCLPCREGHVRRRGKGGKSCTWLPCKRRITSTAIRRRISAGIRHKYRRNVAEESHCCH